MANVQGGSATGSFTEHLTWSVTITGIGYNSAGGANYTFTPTVRGRNLPGSSFVVSGTWATSTSVTVQAQGSNDGTNWVPIGSALTASSGTVPQAGSLTGGSLIFSYYNWTVTGGDSGTNLTITARFAQFSP